MKLLSTRQIGAIAIAAVLSLASGCKNEATTTGSTDITYNAIYVVNGGGNSISVIDIATNEVKRTIPLSGVSWAHHVNINGNKNRIAIAVPGMDFSGGHGGMMGMPGKIVVLDATTGAVIRSLDLPVMNHNAVFSPNGNEIWTSQMDSMGSVLVFDATTFTPKDTIMVGQMPQEVTFSSDGSMAFVANGMSNTVTIIDPANKTVMMTVSVGMNPVGAWTGANNKMYVDNEEGQSISVIDVATMAVEETVPLGFTPGYAAYNAQLNELWVSDTSGRVVYFQRMNNQWMNMGNISTGAGAHAIAFSRNDSTAYVTNQMAGTVSVINTATHAKVKDVTVGAKPNGMAIKM
ncbi:MAG: YncE family protein [Ignavibacteriae bacterium]|nr:YncE family protein [Ignavibacteriota bacterium]